MEERKNNQLLHRQRKEIALKAVAQAGEILGRLYLKDKPRYQPLFGWLNKMLAPPARKSPVLLLQTIKRLEEKELGPSPAVDVVQYCGGTLRKLESERESKQFRQGTGPALLGDIIDRAKREVRGKG